ncbi:MAG: helix-turn-helix domain-containing protein [Chitinivibrionales bacterium]|nr:helix-turn-helix domain-containing protein [Chitinivibrionales bacterium]
MPNIAAVLKDEIARLARKEIRSQTASVAKASGNHRRDIAALKRQVAQLERAVDVLKRNALKDVSSLPAVEPGKSVRFSPKGFVAQRKRLGLSAVDAAKVLGVSANTIYNWEHEHTRPGKEQLALIAAMRGMGKREAGARLKQAEKQPRTARKK